MKCANCERPALFVYEGAGIRPVSYCDAHLPRFLQGAARKGSLRTTEAYAATQRAALSALAPLTAIAVDTAPEPAPEPAPEETAAPKKRRRKTKSEQAAVEVPQESPEEIVEAEAVEEQPED